MGWSEGRADGSGASGTVDWGAAVRRVYGDGIAGSASEGSMNQGREDDAEGVEGSGEDEDEDAVDSVARRTTLCAGSARRHVVRAARPRASFASIEESMMSPLAVAALSLGRKTDRPFVAERPLCRQVSTQPSGRGGPAGPRQKLR